MGFNSLCKLIIEKEGYKLEECPKLVNFYKDSRILVKVGEKLLQKDLFCGYYLEKCKYPDY